METNVRSPTVNGNGSDHALKDQKLMEHSERAGALHQVRTAGSVIMSPELFEKLYLAPKTDVKGHLRSTFGNPTPVALIGFVLSLTPLSCDLMGWRGAGGNGAASVGVYLFFGGLLMIIGGVMEFILGNTFPFVVFCSFGGFWLSFAATLTPFYNAYGAYSPTDNPVDGLNTVGFNASFGFFLVFFALLCFIFLICSLRTNIAFVLIFLTVTISVACLVGVYFQAAVGNLVLVERLKVVAGAFSFIAGMVGWYLVAVLLLASVDFPLTLPVGDLSTIIKGASESRKNSSDLE